MAESKTEKKIKEYEKHVEEKADFYLKNELGLQQLLHDAILLKKKEALGVMGKVLEWLYSEPNLTDRGLKLTDLIDDLAEKISNSTNQNKLKELAK